MGTDGRVFHTWYLPDVEEPSGNFELVGNGEIIARCKQTQLVRLDRDSNLIWKIEIPVHLDLDPTADGGLVLLVKQRIRRYEGRRVQFGGIAFLGPDGRRRHDNWLAFERLDELKRFHRESSLDTPRSEVEESQDADGGEARGREERRPRRVRVLSLEHDRAPARYAARPPRRAIPGGESAAVPAQRQHDPGAQPGYSAAGLELDRGAPEPSPHADHPSRRPHSPLRQRRQARRSRILEIEALTGEVVWRSPETDVRAFFSLSRGSSQRLPNGNTLICESDRGHAFEITPEGERVWAFRHPVRKRGRRRAIYRMMRLSREEVTLRMRVDGRSESGAR